MRKAIGIIHVAALVLGALLAAAALVLAFNTWREAVACCAADWRQTTYWWLVASKLADAVSAALVTFAFAMVYRRNGASLFAPLLYGVSFVACDLAAYVVFRNAGKMAGPELYWSSVASWAFARIFPAVILAAILLGAEYRASDPDRRHPG